MDLNTLKQKMDEAHYIYDDTLAMVLAVALRLELEMEKSFGSSCPQVLRLKKKREAIV